MWQQKQNNSTAMDELTGLPGEMPMEKDRVWQKLEGRIHQKTRRVKPVWYWAAACAAATVFFLYAEFAEKNTTGADLTLRPQEHISTVPVVPAQKDIPVVIHTAPQVKKNNYAAALIAKPHRTAVPVLRMIPPDPALALAPAIIQPHVPVHLSPGLDTGSLVSTLVKKKLRVVSVNELDDADRFAAQRLPKTGNNYSNTKNAAKKEYAGMLNFRIYLKN